MLSNYLWRESRALNKAALLLFAGLLLLGLCLSLFAKPGPLMIAFFCGFCAYSTLAYADPEVNLLTVRFWVPLPVVCLLAGLYNLVCFGYRGWLYGSCMCLFMFLLTAVVRSKHGFPLAADEQQVVCVEDFVHEE